MPMPFTMLNINILRIIETVSKAFPAYPQDFDPERNVLKSASSIYILLLRRYDSEIPAIECGFPPALKAYSTAIKRST